MILNFLFQGSFVVYLGAAALKLSRDPIRKRIQSNDVLITTSV